MIVCWSACISGNFIMGNVLVLDAILQLEAPERTGQTCKNSHSGYTSESCVLLPSASR